MQDELRELKDELKTAMNDGFIRLEKKIERMEEQSIQNGKDVAMQSKEIEHINQAITRNFEQHKDFYEYPGVIDTRIVDVETRVTKLETKLLVYMAVLSGAFTLAMFLIDFFKKG